MSFLQFSPYNTHTMKRYIKSTKTGSLRDADHKPNYFVEYLEEGIKMVLIL